MQIKNPMKESSMLAQRTTPPIGSKPAICVTVVHILREGSRGGVFR